MHKKTRLFRNNLVFDFSLTYYQLFITHLILLQIYSKIFEFITFLLNYFT